jgi:hypothetical protein
MTKTEQPKTIPFPLLFVYGKPTSPDIPQASWFRAEDRPGVTAAAQALKFAVIDINTEADRTLLAGVHEGVLKAGGQLIVGSVAVDVYKRIEDYVAKAAGAASATGSSEIAGSKTLSEQTANIEDKGADGGGGHTHGARRQNFGSVGRGLASSSTEPCGRP